MTEIQRRQEIDPFESVGGHNKREEIQFVNSKCMTCGEMGEWVLVTKDENGRIQTYTTFDVDHYKGTGGKKGGGHKEFHHFTLTRNHAEVFIF